MDHIIDRIEAIIKSTESNRNWQNYQVLTVSVFRSVFSHQRSYKAETLTTDRSRAPRQFASCMFGASLADVCIESIGCIRTRSDASGCIRMRSDAFGCVWTLSEILLKKYVFHNFCVVSEKLEAWDRLRERYWLASRPASHLGIFSRGRRPSPY